ncbi:MAG: hypothetical protein JKZ03_04085 [Flavobacteriaceae bacterium]|nr:hypothetical protein [Flavobacteriaceae bacterium]
MKVVWSKNAQYSYGEELEFIDKKWTSREVENFMTLVENFIKNLETGIIKGKMSPKTNMRSFVISKQTTLFFTFHENTETIELLLFWNNLRSPKALKKKLKGY